MDSVVQNTDISIQVTINGELHQGVVESRKLLVDFLRDDVGLTGTHVGCEQGVCGSCTVMVDGQTVRSCLTFAVQAAGREVWTVEGLAADGDLSPLQQEFWSRHALQCGFCTPGMLMAAVGLLMEGSDLDEEQIRVGLSGNICRCTGYQNIVEAVLATSKRYQSGEVEPWPLLEEIRSSLDVKRREEQA